jgi:outer membrane protein
VIGRHHSSAQKARGAAVLTIASLIGGVAPSSAAGESPGYGFLPAAVVNQSFGTTDCILGALSNRLNVADALNRALCTSPEVRQAWATTKVNAAQFDIAQEARWPTITAVVTDGLDRASSVTPSETAYNSDVKYTAPSLKLTFDFVVYDFGVISAKALSAREALESAMAMQSESLRTIMITVLGDYYDAVDAQDQWKSDQDLVIRSKSLVDVATARYKGGGALIIDMLQAQSDFEQAEIKEATDRGKWNTSRGTLSNDIGVVVDAKYDIDDSISVAGAATLDLPIDRILSIAEEHSAKLQADEADIKEAMADMLVEERTGLPTLSLQANLTAGRDLYSPVSAYAINQTPGNTYSHDRYVGLQLTIPITTFAQRRQHIHEAGAKVIARQTTRETDAKKLALEVWTDYSNVQSAREVLEASDRMVEVATEYAEVTDGRYFGGAGAISDAISAQHALEDARLKRATAIAELGDARLNLLVAVGQLDDAAARQTR